MLASIWIRLLPLAIGNGVLAAHAIRGRGDEAWNSTTQAVTLSGNASLAATVTSNNDSATSTVYLTSTFFEVITLLPARPATATGTASVRANTTSRSLNSTSITNATNSTTALSGFAAAQSCNTASLSWSSSYLTSTGYNSTFLAWTTWLSTSAYRNVSTYTLCDGFPRADITIQKLSSSYDDPFEYSSTFLVNQTTDPPPSCTIAPTDCSSLWSSYLTSEAHKTGHVPFWLTPPACPTPASLGTTFCSEDLVYSVADHPPCIFNAEAVRLVYFPPEIRPANETARLCGNYTTYTNNATTPVYATALGTTFTSGTAYISFQSLGATNRCGSMTGTNMQNFILPVRPDEVSSLCAEYGEPDFGGLPTSLNFADLADPVPLSAYSCQAKCDLGFYREWQELCPTIYKDYAPVLAFPIKIKDLQPEWQSCWFDSMLHNSNFLWDPPIALQPASAAATLTKPIAAPTTAAQPASSTAHTLPTSEPVSNQAPSENPAPPPPVSSALPDDHPVSSNHAPDQAVSNAAVQSDPLTRTETPTSTGAIGVLISIIAGIASSTKLASVSIPGAQNTGGNSVVSLTAGQPAAASINTHGAAPSLQDPITISQVGTNAIINGQTVAPGQATAINGQSVSADASGVFVLGSSAAITLDPGQQTVIAGQQNPITISQAGTNAILNGQTIAPGQTTIINGQAVSADTSGVVVIGNSATITLAPGQQTIVAGQQPSPVTISKSGSDYIIDGLRLDPGQGGTVDGVAVSELPGGNGLVVGSSTVVLANGQGTDVAIPGATAVNAPLQSITVSRSGNNYIVDGTTLSPGAVQTVDGQIVSALPSGNGVAVGSNTISLPQGAATAIAQTLFPEATLTAASQTLTVFGVVGQLSEVVVGGTTLTAGIQRLTIDGETYSLGSSGLIQIGNGHTSTIALQGAATTISGGFFPEATITAGSQTLAVFGVAGQTSIAVVDGTTLTRGGVPVTINGETYSLGWSGLVQVGSGHTSTIALAGTASSLIPEATLIAGSETLTAYGVAGHTGVAVIDGTTLTAGGQPVTIDGETFSLGSSGLVQVDGGHTSTIASVGNVDPTRPPTAAYTGGASRTTRSMGLVCLIAVAVLLNVVMR